MRIYLAGRIRSCANYRAIFADAAQKLRSHGFEVYNPAAANLEGMPLPKIMAHVLPQLCECDAIYMIPGWWRRFGGAWIEIMLAWYLGIKRIYL